jgi:patatin-like phospholipase/acyl hydrolase
METTRPIRILSLDGGGIRGLLSAHILAALEKKINEHWQKQNPDKTLERPLRLSNYFDMVAGTSTGGILGCILMTPDPVVPHYPKYSGIDAVKLYRDFGKAIFKKTWTGRLPLLPAFFGSKFTGNNLESILQERFGDIRMSSLLNPCLITSYDIEKRKALFFTKQDAVEKGDMYDFYVKDVARSTSAAPTYFPPFRFESMQGLKNYAIDGGLFANNPTMCAVIEALKLFGTKTPDGGTELLSPANMFILSIGTGTVKKPYMYEKAVSWGLLNWVSPIIDIMMSGVSETVDYQLRKLYSSIGESDHYFRLMPNLYTADSEMDNVSDANLDALNQAGIQNVQDFDNQLELIAAKLMVPSQI